MANDGAPWYRDPAARTLILRRYVPWLAGLSLAWEIAQLPLDVLIGSAALAAALVVTQAPALAGWQWRHIAVVTAIVATSYTAFSECYRRSFSGCSSHRSRCGSPLACAGPAGTARSHSCRTRSSRRASDAPACRTPGNSRRTGKRRSASSRRSIFRTAGK
jgi:hypothetical protein